METNFTGENFENSGINFSQNYNWILGGEVHPCIQDQVVHTGTGAVQFGDIENNQQSFFELNCQFTENIVLSFWGMVDSESTYDYIEFLIDDTVELTIRSSLWDPYHLILNPGTYKITWRYSKDGSVSSGRDTAWVDDITIQ